MNKFKKIISLVCLIVLSVILFAGCEDNNIVKLRQDFDSLNFENYYGYMQTVDVQAGDLSYTSYIKMINYNGQDYKVYEMEKTLNGLDSADQFTVVDNTYYIVDGKKRELVDGEYKETENAEISLSLGINIKEEYFKGFSVQEDQTGIKIFNGILLPSKASQFINREIQNINTMTLKVIVRSGKLSTCTINYTKTDNTVVDITTIFYTEVQSFDLPE